MKTVFKSTVRDIIRDKNNIYFLFFGAFFFMIGYGLKFSIQRFGDNPKDFSQYGQLIILNIWFFIFYLAITISANRDLKEEIDEGFIEISLLSLSRFQFFFGKFLAYVFSYFCLLELIIILGSISSKMFLGTPFNMKIFVGAAGLVLNIAFIVFLMFFFVMKSHLKSAGFTAFITFIFLSLLNSYTVMNWIFKSNSISKFLSIFSPAVFNIQNEFLRFGTSFEFTVKFPIIFLNILVYLMVFFIMLVKIIKNYEWNN